MLQFYARVVVELELRYVQRPLLARANLVVYTSGSDFSIYRYNDIYIVGECMALLASGSDPTA